MWHIISGMWLITNGMWPVAGDIWHVACGTSIRRWGLRRLAVSTHALSHRSTDLHFPHTLSSPLLYILVISIKTPRKLPGWRRSPANCRAPSSPCHLPTVMFCVYVCHVCLSLYEGAWIWSNTGIGQTQALVKHRQW